MNDLLLTDSFDLVIENGDLVIGEAANQNQELLILAMKGELRETPTRGVGVRNWLLAKDKGSLNGAIKREFERDGMQVTTIRNQGGSLQIVAEYE